MFTSGQTLLHLKGGRVWTMVQDPPSNHDELTRMCHYHLVFMGCGIFMDLKQHLVHSSGIAPSLQDTAMDFIKLTKAKMEILNGAVFRGLSVGIA